jgi:hypothetical protein
MQDPVYGSPTKGVPGNPEAPARSVYCPAVEFLAQLISSPLLAALVAVGGVVATIKYTNQRERDRQEHERELKGKELAAERQSRLRDERIAAYRRLLAATTTAHTEREAVEELAEAQAEISLLAGSPELAHVAEKVWVRYGETQRTADKSKKDPTKTPPGDFAQALNKARLAREEFLGLARKELGVDPDQEGP